ncbi:MAG: YCF48-related protein [Phycisphaerales bacterium]
MNRTRMPCSPHLAALAAVGIASIAPAQDWQRQSPLPTNRPLYSVAFSTPMHGFVVALNGTLCETLDGGQTWTTRFQQPYSTDPMYKIVFADEMHGYITGNPGAPFNMRTTDGGATWLPMANLNLGSTYDIDFITPTTGFTSPGGFLVGFTTDGGQTWEERFHDPALKWWSMDFVSETTGLVSGYVFSTFPRVEGLFRTTDGGRTFERVYDRVGDPVWLSPTEAIAFEVETNVAAQVSVVHTHRSFDAGQTWSLV